MHFISNIQYFKEFLFKNRFIIFQKFCFSKISIEIVPIFLSIEIVLKNYCESLSVSINRN